MKAYNETWVENANFLKKIDVLKNENQISEEEYQKAKDEFPEDFYKPNWLIKLGLFIFTGVASFFLISLFFLFSNIYDNNKALGFCFIFISILQFFVLEFLIKARKFYRSGIDNALLYLSIGFMFYGVIVFSDDRIHGHSYPLILFLILVPCLIRYADMMVTVASFVSFLLFVVLNVNDLKPAQSFLPFIIILISAGIFFYSKSKTLSTYYYDAQQMIEILALVTFCLAGNYLIVRELSGLLNNEIESKEIALKSIFWVYTFLTPFLVIGYGVRYKERKAIGVGLIAIFFAIYTFRQYNSIMKIEVALSLEGFVLIIISIFCLKYFKTPRFNISSNIEKLNNFQKLESLIVSQSISGKLPNENNIEFGNGEFGGGGATDKY